MLTRVPIELCLEVLRFLDRFNVENCLLVSARLYNIIHSDNRRILNQKLSCDLHVQKKKLGLYSVSL